MSIRYVIFIVVIGLMVSCKKEVGIAGPAGPAGMNGHNANLIDTGTLYGNLTVFNEFGWPMTDSSGVAVSLDLGTDKRTVASDASGNYYFHGLPSGTYNLTYAKAGFGTMKMFGLAHSPGSSLNTLVNEVYILQNPVRTAIDSVTMIEGYSYVILTIYLDTSSLTYVQSQHNFAVLIGTKADLSPASVYFSGISEFVSPDGHGAYSVVISRSDLGGINHQGGTYYIRVGTYTRIVRAFANPYSFFDTGPGGYYIDPADGKYVFPNLKLSPGTITIQ